MVAQKPLAQASVLQKVVPKSADIGFCLGCGARISRCGRPFSDAIRCHKCNALNIYEDSQQPVRISGHYV